MLVPFFLFNRAFSFLLFAGSMRASSRVDGTCCDLTTRRNEECNVEGVPLDVVVRDVSRFARLADISGLHERSRIHRTGVRAFMSGLRILRTAGRKPKEGYKATTRPF